MQLELTFQGIILITHYSQKIPAYERVGLEQEILEYLPETSITLLPNGSGSSDNVCGSQALSWS